MTTIEKDFEDLKARFEAFQEKYGDSLILMPVAKEGTGLSFADQYEAKPWPQEGDMVWVISTLQPKGYNKIYYCPSDFKHALAMGLMYRTEEEAQRRVKHDRLLTEVNGAKGFVADWGAGRQENYFIEYDNEGRRFVVALCWGHKTGSRIKPYPTREAAQAVIDKYGDDLKLLFEVV